MKKTSSIDRVRAQLEKHKHPHPIIRLEETAHSAQQACDALGCKLEQITKSIVFREAETDGAILVLASGVNRVDTDKVERIINQKTVRADAQFVRDKTGFAIGGVSPIGHITQVNIIIDKDLFQWDEIWAAAGHPQCLFKLDAHALQQMTGGVVADIRVD